MVAAGPYSRARQPGKWSPYSKVILLGVLSEKVLRQPDVVGAREVPDGAKKPGEPLPGVAARSGRLSPGHRPVPQTMTRFAQNQQRTVLLTVGRTGCGSRVCNQRDPAWQPLSGY